MLSASNYDMCIAVGPDNTYHVQDISINHMARACVFVCVGEPTVRAIGWRDSRVSQSWSWLGE
jgi:hypothetical protein